MRNLHLQITLPANPVHHVVEAGECVARDSAHRLQAIAAARLRKALARTAAA